MCVVCVYGRGGVVLIIFAHEIMVLKTSPKISCYYCYQSDFVTLLALTRARARTHTHTHTNAKESVLENESVYIVSV